MSHHHDDEYEYDVAVDDSDEEADVAVDTPQKWFLVKAVRKIVQSKYGALEDGMTWDRYVDEHVYELLADGLDYSCQSVICSSLASACGVEVDDNSLGNLDDALEAVQGSAWQWCALCYYTARNRQFLPAFPLE